MYSFTVNCTVYVCVGVEGGDCVCDSEGFYWLSQCDVEVFQVNFRGTLSVRLSMVSDLTQHKKMVTQMNINISS